MHQESEKDTNRAKKATVVQYADSRQNKLIYTLFHYILLMHNY